MEQSRAVLSLKLYRNSTLVNFQDAPTVHQGVQKQYFGPLRHRNLTLMNRLISALMDVEGDEILKDYHIKGQFSDGSFELFLGELHGAPVILSNPAGLCIVPVGKETMSHHAGRYWYTWKECFETLAIYFAQTRIPLAILSEEWDLCAPDDVVASKARNFLIASVDGGGLDIVEETCNNPYSSKSMTELASYAKIVDVLNKVPDYLLDPNWTLFTNKTEIT